MPSVAYLTTADLSEFSIYDALTVEPLRQRGFEVESVDWRAVEDWDRFEAVLPRSPWDYHLHLEHFFDVLADIEASGAELFNDLEVMRWNANKSYLGDLGDRGVRIVATEYGTQLNGDRIEDLRRRLGTRELVLKPAISANAKDTFLLQDGGDPSGAIASLHGREWLAQPFMSGIVDEGEFSLIYFDGELSHTLLKKADPGDFRVQENWGGTIRPVVADGRLRDRADQVLAALPEDLLYARIDLVRSNGDFALMEAELIEPSLYFGIDPAAPARFAEALVERLGAGA